VFPIREEEHRGGRNERDQTDEDGWTDSRSNLSAYRHRVLFGRNVRRMGANDPGDIRRGPPAYVCHSKFPHNMALVNICESSEAIRVYPFVGRGTRQEARYEGEELRLPNAMKGNRLIGRILVTTSLLHATLAPIIICSDSPKLAALIGLTSLSILYLALGLSLLKGKSWNHPPPVAHSMVPGAMSFEVWHDAVSVAILIGLNRYSNLPNFQASSEICTDSYICCYTQ
jgi:hypothetical protein